MKVNQYDKKIRPREGELVDYIRECSPTDTAIAEFLGISRNTFYKYRKEFPEFAELVDNAIKSTYRKVENEVYKNALGYDTKEVIEEFDANGKLKYRKVTIKHIAGDLGAEKFILQNRQRMRWDVTDQPTVNIDNKLDLSNLTKEELLRIAGDDIE